MRYPSPQIDPTVWRLVIAGLMVFIIAIVVFTFKRCQGG
jgi:hypothetical protein